MKIYDEKTKRCSVVFKEYDFKLMDELGKRSCVKCGAKLKR